MLYHTVHTVYFAVFPELLWTFVEEEHIKKMFSQVVPSVKIVQVRLIRDKVDSSKRGIAFVDVETRQMAEEALNLNEYQLMDKKIEVYLSKPKDDQSRS